MRSALAFLGAESPQHLGLGYETLAPTEASDGKVSDKNRAAWLERLASVSVPDDYAAAFRRWYRSFASAPGGTDEVVVVKTVSRLLVGHGIASGTDVGLCVHRTWGVPYIPGSALKGLAARFVDATYGDDRLDRSPAAADLTDDERSRARFRGPVVAGSRFQFGPGDVYRRIFGAPDSEIGSGRRDLEELLASATRGEVIFHDALYVPNAALGIRTTDRPWAVDVLTVHQKGYYNSQGESEPNDYDSPNPVSFLTVRPAACFLIALSGPDSWRRFGRKILLGALKDYGIGGKTSSGYGRCARDKGAERRLAVIVPPPPPPPTPPPDPRARQQEPQVGREPRPPVPVSPGGVLRNEVKSSGKEAFKRMAKDFAARCLKLDAADPQRAEAAREIISRVAEMRLPVTYAAWFQKLKPVAGDG